MPVALLWLWVLACGGPDGDGSPGLSPADSGSTGSSDTSAVAATNSTGSTGSTASTGSTGASGTADTGPPLPMVDEALAGRCEPTFPDVPVDAALHRVTLDAAVGRCNDGTPPVLFVRPASDPEEDRWVVYFDGGSRCAEGEDCAVRWCGEGFYDATKMSSRWAPEVRDIRGLHTDREGNGDDANAFAGWNHVFVYYCSSDFWVGQAADVPLTTADGIDYRVHFEGALIVDDVVDWLLAGGSSDDGQVTMGSVRDASELLVAGSSAGGMGVTQHVDAIADAVAPVPVKAVIDAMVTPDASQMGTPGLDDLWADELRRQYDEEVTARYDARLHPGCLADRPGEPWRCWEPSLLQLDYLRVPFFLHHDLRDLTLSDTLRGMGATLPGYAAASKLLLEQVIAERPEAGVHGGACTYHTVLSDDARFYAHAVYDVTMHDGIDAWLAGDTVQVVDRGLGGDSTCP